MNEQGQLLRAIDTRAVVLSAAEIPRLGFGESEMTRNLGNGLISSQVVQRWFRLSCGCVVRQLEECSGDPCQRCRELLVQELLLRGNGELSGLGQAELDWLCTPCKENHHFRCAFPCCSVRGCYIHVPMADNGEHYCEEHFDLVQEELGLLRTRERHGVAVAGLKRFCQSLFFDKWIDMTI